MENIDDNDLIRFAQLGDMGAFQDLVEKYKNRAIGIASRMVGNYEDARDISQDAFIRVYRSLATYKLGNNFYTWFYRIVTNLCIDFLRKQKNRNKIVHVEEIEDLQSHEISVSEYLAKKELDKDVQSILDQLPDLYRVVLVLRDIEGFNCKEIEDMLNCNHNTARWRLFRARQLFKELWEKAHQN